MRTLRRLLCGLIGLLAGLPGVQAAAVEAGVPILAYHRFGPVVADSMTVKTVDFAAQLQWLKDNGYTVIPLRSLVDYLLHQGPQPPAKAVAITADDGHKSVYTDMWPVVRRFGIPVTLFIYPSAISNAAYALTWEQLKELQRSGQFDIQSHTLWSPNFKKEKKRLPPEAYRRFVQRQLEKSKAVLEKHANGPVSLLAWPFGIYDGDLETMARDAGYAAAFSIDRRHAGPADDIMSLPRYMVVNGGGIAGFAAVVAGRAAGKRPAN